MTCGRNEQRSLLVGRATGPAALRSVLRPVGPPSRCSLRGRASRRGKSMCQTAQFLVDLEALDADV